MSALRADPRAPLVMRALAGVALAALLLGGLARLVPELGPAAIAARLAGADGGAIAAAALVYLLALPLRALRWRLLVGEAGGRLGFWRASAVSARGWFANIVLPARLGDVGRAGAGAGHGLGKRAALGTIASERLADLMALAAVTAAALGFAGPTFAPLRPLLLALAGILAGSITVGLVVAARLERRGGEHRIARLAAPFLSALHFGRTRRAAGAVLACSLLAWAAEGGALVLAARALGLTALTPSDVFTVAMAAAALSALPATPAGLGLVEGGLLGLLTLVNGVAPAEAAGLIAAFRVVTLVPIAIVGTVSSAGLWLAGRRRAGEPEAVGS